MESIQDIKEDQDTIAGKCRQLADLLGLEGPVSEAVLLGAFYDESYAHNLLVTRRDPEFLQLLLDNPPEVPEAMRPAEVKSTGELLGKVTEAVWKWAKTGFSTVDEAMLDKRIGACMQCPYLTDKPDNLLYKVAPGKAGEKICRLCGCLVDRKTRLTSENCPDRHPDKPGLSRWEEPIN